MSAWKRLALESFPEWSGELEPALAVETSSVLSSRLVEALQAGDAGTARMIVGYANWAWAEGAKNEPLLHLSMDIIREPLRREPLRTQLWAALPQPAFARLLPAASGALARDISAEFESEYRHTVR